MTTYLLHWSISLLGLLLVYQLLLARQPLPRLKRAYLLAALLVPLVAPLLRVELPFAPALTGLDVPYERLDVMPFGTDRPVTPPMANVPAQAQQNTARMTYWLWLYGLGTLLMFARFGRNLVQLARQVRRHSGPPFQGATLVLLPGAVVPHTFCHYLFVSEAEWKQGRIEPQLLTHELAHIRQRHSLDVLLVEALLCVGWFNPLVVWLKRLMQVNHECLADQAVIGMGNTSDSDVRTYQHLLLDRLMKSRTQPLPTLTSTLTFQTTKQRLYMMTKQTTRARAWLTGTIATSAFSLVVLFIMLTASTSVPSMKANVPASQSSGLAAAGPDPSRLPQRPPATRRQIEEVERWYSNHILAVPDKAVPTKWVRRKYADLTPAEKQFVVCLLPEPPRTISPVQLNAYKNATKFSVSVDDQPVQDFTKTKLTADDIAFYRESYYDESLHIPTYISLYTRTGYAAYRKQKEANPLVFVNVTKW